VVQQVLVANLRSAIGSASWAVLISYIGGTFTMIAIVAIVREPWVAGAGVAKSSLASWGAGAFGVLYVMLAIALIPKLGAATVVALLVAGQLIASLAFDHFGLLGVPRQPADLQRVLGALMLLGGVVLIRS
jgi:transporter family-2 protein